jgi:hypothetical protein
MNFDFPAFLVLASLVTGGIWLIDALLFAPRRRRLAGRPRAGPRASGGRRPSYKEPVLVEYARSFFPVILIVLLLRSFLVEPFRIPSGSMMPTLLTGDFILVNKFAYGLRWPVLNTKFVEVGEPAARRRGGLQASPRTVGPTTSSGWSGSPATRSGTGTRPSTSTASPRSVCPSGPIRGWGRDS